MLELGFFKGKKVFITGHTGFKGSWLCRILVNAGAFVTGYSLEPEKTNLFELADIQNRIESVIGDIRDYKMLKTAFDKAQPEIVIHLAAQPIVRESYKYPAYTYQTNVMGTVNILECVRANECVKSFLNVTTDKVYLNDGRNVGYREEDPLDGFDPYSNSKSCAELITHSYFNSFFQSEAAPAISTVRAGNVIGGGDFANGRIIPDCIRAVQNSSEILVRNPFSVRPYQYVLEVLYVYLMIIKMQYENKKYAGWYNVGPEEKDCVTTGTLVDMFCKAWGEGIKWKNVSEENAPHEASTLMLDSSKLKKTFAWSPKNGIENAVIKTVEWSKAYLNKEDVVNEMNRQIDEYFAR